MAGGDATRLTCTRLDVLVGRSVVEVDVDEAGVVDEAEPVGGAAWGRAALLVGAVLSAAGPGAGCVVLGMNPGRVPVPATPLVLVVAGRVVEVDVGLPVVGGGVPGRVPGGGYEGTLDLVVVDELGRVVVVVVEVGAEVEVVGRVVVVTGLVVVVTGLVVVVAGLVVVVVVLDKGTVDEVVPPPGTVVVVVVIPPVVVVVPGNPITFDPELEVLAGTARGSAVAAPAAATAVREPTAATENSTVPVAVQVRRSLGWDFAGLLPAAFRGEDIRAPTSVRGSATSRPAGREDHSARGRAATRLSTCVYILS